MSKKTRAVNPRALRWHSLRLPRPHPAPSLSPQLDLTGCDAPCSYQMASNKGSTKKAAKARARKAESWRGGRTDLADVMRSGEELNREVMVMQDWETGPAGTLIDDDGRVVIPLSGPQDTSPAGWAAWQQRIEGLGVNTAALGPGASDVCAAWPPPAVLVKEDGPGAPEALLDAIDKELATRHLKSEVSAAREHKKKCAEAERQARDDERDAIKAVRKARAVVRRGEEEARLKIKARWQKIWVVIKEMREIRHETAKNILDRQRQQQVRWRAEAAAAARTERPYTPAGPSHRDGPVAYVEPYDAVAAAVRTTDKEEGQARYHAEQAVRRKREQEQHARKFKMEQALETADAIGRYGC